MTGENVRQNVEDELRLAERALQARTAALRSRLST
jgi:hypothetical protein